MVPPSFLLPVTDLGRKLLCRAAPRPPIIIDPCVVHDAIQPGLPDGRVVVAFMFPEERPTNRRFWILINDREAELCQSNPGGPPDLTVEARSQAFVDWHRGARAWRDVLRTGDVTVSGPPRLRRAFPTWNRHALVVDPEYGGLAG